MKTRTGQLCMKHKQSGTVIKLPITMILSSEEVQKEFVHVPKKKYKSFINKQTKKDNNYAFLEACVKKGLQLMKIDEHHVMPVFPGIGKIFGMGSRTLYGIQLNEE